MEKLLKFYELVSIDILPDTDGVYYVKFPNCPDLCGKEFSKGEWNARYMNLATHWLKPIEINL